MLDFEFYSPTKIFFGKNAENKTSHAITWAGGSRVLLVCGGASAKKSGLFGRIEAQLKEEGIVFDSIGGVKPNPLLSLAREGVRKAVDFKADMVLAIGGGSVIDTAKAIAIGAANPDEDIWDVFWLGKKIPLKALPVGVILTISAAGSETSSSAVLTNDDTRMKSGINADVNRPKFAIMNPELTYTLPQQQIRNGIADIMMHTLDRYFTAALGNDFTDAVAEALLRTVIRNGPVMLKTPDNYKAASEIMWCGSVSHNHLTGLGGISDFSVHQLSMPLSGVFDMAHGAALTAVWGDWAKYVMNSNPGRFARLGREVFGDAASYSAVEDAALSSIEHMVAFFESIGMPTNFSSLGLGVVSDEILRDLAERCSYNRGRVVGNFRPIDHDDMYEIYKMANR
ncbi:MAG: iron-containing alcohol dehydrogenase [Peptococcaceae bacterium]|nr:iron-containing alcohol dehydrogenase [Peptococcaceae bacterium]